MHRTSGNVTVIDLDGKITLGEGELLSEVLRLIEQGHHRILLNLAHVPYFHSSALGEVMRTREALIRICNCRHIRREHAGDNGTGACMQPGCDCRSFQGGILKLLNPSKPITDLLTVSRLSTFFEAFNSEEAAVGSFQQ
jgi:anti-anti-sigma regulatory factor